MKKTRLYWSFEITRMKSISMNTDEQVVLHTTECILFD